MSQVAYEIRVLGEVPARLVDDFDKLTVVPDQVGATLHAELADQAELHGLLEALRREGLVLVDVRRKSSFD